MAIDFFGVRLQGRIREYVAGSGKGPGKVVELWVDSQESALTDRESLGALAFVSEINLRLVQSDNCTIALVLTPPFEEGLSFLQTELVRGGVGQLEVEIGYTTGTTSGTGAIQQTVLPFSGLLQKPDVSIGSDITITLHGNGVGHSMNAVGGIETEQFPENSTYADAVRLTLEKYVSTDGGSSGVIIKDLYKYVPDEKKDPNKTNDPFFKVPKPNTVTNGKSNKPDAKATPLIIDKGPRNDWWFVKETVEKFGYDIIIEGNQIFIIEKTSNFYSEFSKRKPRKHFILRGAVDPTLNIYPILSFSSQNESVYAQPGVGRLVSNDVDTNKKSENGKKEEANQSNVEIGRGKDSQNFPDIAHLPRTDFSNLKELFNPLNSIIKSMPWSRIMAGDPNNPEDVAQMRAHWIDMNVQNGIQADITTIGIPDITPGEIIQVSGFEPFRKFPDKDKAIFNGIYGILEVNHKIGVGGWETSLKAQMNYYPKAFNDAMSQASLDERKKKEEEENEKNRMIDNLGINVIKNINKQIVAASQNPSQPSSQAGTKTVKPKDGQ